MFTYLLEGLGVKDVQFEELLTLEEAELEQLRYVAQVLMASRNGLNSIEYEKLY